MDVLDCIICHPSPDNLLLRESRGTVLLDDPVRVGHVLVGASEHAESLHNLASAMAGAVMSLASDVAKEIVSSTGAEKVYVAAIGDKDKHFHLHLVPRYADDSGLGPFVFGPEGWVGTFGADPSAVSADQIRERIKTKIG